MYRQENTQKRSHPYGDYFLLESSQDRIQLTPLIDISIEKYQRLRAISNSD